MAQDSRELASSDHRGFETIVLTANGGLKGLRLLIKTRLWAQVLVAMVLGVVFGLVFSPSSGGAFAFAPESTDHIGNWLRLPGTLFLNMIQMVVIPLIATSIILGITSTDDPDFLRRSALRIIPYFVATTTVAVLIGAILANLISPGAYIDQSAIAEQTTEAVEIAPTPQDTTDLALQFANLVPSNLSEATLNRNMLQIVVAAIFAAVAILSLGGARTQPLRDLIRVVQDVSLKIVSWAMLLAPLAVFGLIADFVLRVGFSGLIGMSAYIGTVLAGLAMLLGVYLLVATVLGRRNPATFLGAIADAQLLAFSTSSSAATLPLSLETAQKRLNVKPAISKFIIPLGATINMDGTALYQVVAAIFISQLYGVSLPPETLAILMVTVVGASIGSPSTPGVGIVVLATILQTIGVPPSGAAILLGVDRLLDMCRTAVNVTGDLTACVVMDRWLAEPDNVKERETSEEPGVETSNAEG